MCTWQGVQKGNAYWALFYELIFYQIKYNELYMQLICDNIFHNRNPNPLCDPPGVITWYLNNIQGKLLTLRLTTLLTLSGAVTHNSFKDIFGKNWFLFVLNVKVRIQLHVFYHHQKCIIHGLSVKCYEQAHIMHINSAKLSIVLVNLEKLKKLSLKFGNWHFGILRFWRFDI